MYAFYEWVFVSLILSQFDLVKEFWLYFEFGLLA